MFRHKPNEQVTIYYAHNKALYNTEEEAKELKILSERFPDAKIVNPNGDFPVIKFEDCFPVIFRCDAIIFSTFEDGLMGKGVYSELWFARQHDIPFYWLDDEYNIVPEGEFVVQVLNTDAWKHHYARTLHVKDDRVASSSSATVTPTGRSHSRRHRTSSGSATRTRARTRAVWARTRRSRSSTTTWSSR